MQYYSCGSDKYTEIKMCDLELFQNTVTYINDENKVAAKLLDIDRYSLIV